VATDGFTEHDGRLFYNGRVCYFWGDEQLVFVKSLKEAKGNRVYYNAADSQVFMKLECLEL
jgi:hypothetical protein